jgi:deoxyribonuclease-4
MAILGAHMSIAGGYSKAVDAAHRCGCDCVQLFTKNNNQWRAREITDAEADQFAAALRKWGITHPIAHDSYLINLASPQKELWTRSVDAMVIELVRAERLRLDYVVTHPGAYTTSSESAGMRRVIRALNEVLRQTRGMRVGCLVETTAGQGTSLGWRFEHLAQLLEGVQQPQRIGVCFDTCHVFAAGYPLGTVKQYRQTMRALHSTVGTDAIKAFHLNDSKGRLGSRVDRHAKIGGGQMGLDPFRLLLADRRFRHVPMYLETPKGMERGEELDVVNLRTLRGLLRKS